MQQFRLFELLLKPSLFSGLSCFIAASLVLGIGNWLYAQRSAFFSDYLFGQFGLVTNLQQSQGNMLEAVTGLFDKPFSYNVVVLLAAIVCGVLVYISLESVTRSVDNVHETWEEIHYANNPGSRNLLEVELGTRWAIRIAATALWIGYWVVWLSIMIPFCLLATRLVFSDFTDASNWFYAVLGMVICFISFHLHVILLRLILLRPRVFGRHTDVEMLSYDNH